MLTRANETERLGAYRKELSENYRFNKTAKAKYLLANLALEELKMATEHAEEPSEAAFDEVAYRFMLAAQANDGIDQLKSFRSRLQKSWIKPVVWSDIINISSLNDSQARNVANNIGLGESADETGIVTAEAIGMLDELDEVSKFKRTEAANVRRGEVAGYLSEATPILLGARHTTTKQFIVPSLAYDDSVSADIAHHVDGIYFDNRKSRDKPRVAYQAETTPGFHPFIHRTIPVIDARIAGNMPKSSRWPHDDRVFVTLRHLVDERAGQTLDATTSSRIDVIASAVLNKIVRH